MSLSLINYIELDFLKERRKAGKKERRKEGRKERNNERNKKIKK